MKIPVTINDKQIELEADPKEKLVHVLRQQKILSVKDACNSSNCGACYILLDNKVAASCIIPCGIVKNCNIITLEYLVKQDIYQDIQKGFDKAHISLCGYCNSGKILLTYEILNLNFTPTREYISNIIDRLLDCCTEKDNLINGILYAYSFHYERQRTLRHGK